VRKSNAAINHWIREQEARLGIKSPKSGELKPPQPTVTVYPGPHAMERLAHFGADRLIANNAAYDSMCERLDAELAGILSDGSERVSLPPDMLTIDGPADPYRR
jgi:hypothetical protein